MRAVAALLALSLLLSAQAQAQAPAWDLPACSRAVLRCKADLDASVAKVIACDAQRAAERSSATAHLDRLMEAHRVESAALRAEADALRAQLSAPAPWWESPILWGAVGLAVGAGLAYQIGRTQ